MSVKGRIENYLDRILPKTTIPCAASPDLDAILPYTPVGNRKDRLSLILFMLIESTSKLYGLLRSNPTAPSDPRIGTYASRLGNRL
jgi:hypothetical protein